MSPIQDALLDLLKDPSLVESGTAVAVLLILVFAVVLYIRYRRRSDEVRTWITRFSSILISKQSDLSWMEFVDEIDDRAAEAGAVGLQWSRFRESLIIRPAEQQAASSCDPHDHFDFWEVWAGADLNPRMLAAIPNILTGAGILGTFIGLTIGLLNLKFAIPVSDAGPASDGDAVKNLMDGINYLLSGAALAFITSIAGLMTSIAFSIAERRRTKAIAGEFADVVSRVRSAFPLRAAETIAEEMLDQLRHQRLQLEKFNTDFAVSMAQALESQLQNSVVSPLRTGMNEVVQSIQGMREDRSQSTEHALSTALDSFREALQASAGREMTAFQDTFRQIDTALRSVIGGLGDVEQNLKGTLESVSVKLDEGLSGSASRFGEEISSSVTMAVTLMAEHTQKIAETMDGVTRQIQTTLAQSTSDLGDEVRNSVRDATTALADDATALGAALREEVTGVNEQYRETLSGLAAATERNRALLGAVGTMLERTQAVQAVHDSTLREFQEAHKSFSSVAAPLAQTAQQLNDGLRTTSEAIQGIRSVSQGLDEAGKRLEEHNQALTRAWSEYRDRFESVDGALAKAFSEVNTGTAAFATQTRDYVQTINNELAKALTQLSGAVSELDTTIEAFAEERGRR